MRIQLLAPLAAAAALFLGSVANATTTHYEVRSRVSFLAAYGPNAETISEANSVFAVGTPCTFSFDYNPDGAVDSTAGTNIGNYAGVFTNLRYSFNGGAYVGTADSAGCIVENDSTYYQADLVCIAGQLQNPRFPDVDRFQFLNVYGGIVRMTDYTKQVLTSNALPATISKALLGGDNPAWLDLHFTDASGAILWVEVSIGQQDIQPPSTYFGLGAAYRNNVFEAIHLYMGATFSDPTFAEPITSVTLTYPDGTVVGSKEGGYSGTYGAGSTSCGAYAGDLFARRRDVPNGAYGITVIGGLRDGLRLTYNLDRALVPLAMPRLICASEFALEHARADRPITVFFWPFLDRQPSAKPNVVLGIYKLEDGEYGPTETSIFNAFEIDPNAISVTIPANTLSTGSFKLVLGHDQTGPASKDGLAATYDISNTISFTRKR